VEIRSAILDNPDAGLFRVHRSMMTSTEVLELEWERIFDRGWLYLGHDTEIEGQGEYRRRTLAGRPLFFVRGRDGQVRVFLNTCTHRGALVCRRDEGTTERFQCFYHGWTFDTEGALVGMPDQAAYAEEFDRCERALKSPPRHESYRGFHFVSFSPEVEPLAEYLGQARELIDLSLDSADLLGGWAVIRGTARYTIHANWKLLVENSMDGYHLPTVHQTYIEYMTERRAQAGAGRVRVEQQPTISRGFALRNGHVGILTNTPGRPIATPSSVWTDSAKQKVLALRQRLTEAYGEERAHQMADVSRHLVIFPNAALQDSHTGFRIRQWWPISPSEMEVTQWEFAPREEDPELRAYRMEGSLAFLGPGGFATPDDIEALESCQLGFQAREAEWSDISRGMQRDPQSTDELQMRGFWRTWYAHMQGQPAPTAVTDGLRKAVALRV
jgi:p-cumate 2,3-dioxygenase alpha subunit